MGWKLAAMGQTQAVWPSASNAWGTSFTLTRSASQFIAVLGERTSLAYRPRHSAVTTTHAEGMGDCREFAQHFVAEATIVSAPTRNLGSLVDSPDIRTSICSEFKVTVSNVRYFEKPVCARDLLKYFKFIAPNRRKMWRIYFQGGAIRLSKTDYELVIRTEKQLLKK